MTLLAQLVKDFSNISRSLYTLGVKMHLGQSDHKWTALNRNVNGLGCI